MHSLASSLAILVTSSEASAIDLAVAMSSLLDPALSWFTSCDSLAIRTDAGIRMKWVRKQPWYQY